MDQSILVSLLARLLHALPFALFYLLGTIVSYVFISRYPTPARFALVGFALNLLLTIATSIAYALIPVAEFTDEIDAERLGQRLTIVENIDVLGFYLALSFLILALLTSRGPFNQPA